MVTSLAKVRLLILILFLSIIILFEGTHAQDYVTVEGEGTVNLREGPGLDAAISEQVNKGQKLKILSKKEDWYEVELEDGKEGWIFSQLVSKPFSEMQDMENGWFCYRGNAQHSDSSSGDLMAKGKEKWVLSIDSDIGFNSSLVFINGKSYIGGRDGKLFSLDLEKGLINDIFQVDAPIDSTLSVNDDYIYFETEDGMVYSFDISSKSKKWEFLRQGTSSGHSPLIGDNGLIYVIGNNNKTIYALTMDKGEEKWTFSGEGDSILSSPCLSEEGIHIGSSNGEVYCLDENTGLLKWKASCGICVGLTMASKKFLYAVATQTEAVNREDLCTVLYAFDIVTGGKKWFFNFDDQVFLPVLMGDNIYIGCQNKNLYSIDSVTGKEKWVLKKEMYPVTMAGSGNFLYVGLYDGTVFALDIKTRQMIWSLKIDGIPGLLSVYEGILYIPTKNGKIYAIE